MTTQIYEWNVSEKKESQIEIAGSLYKISYYGHSIEYIEFEAEGMISGFDFTKIDGKMTLYGFKILSIIPTINGILLTYHKEN
jgi:hypothetical protein